MLFSSAVFIFAFLPITLLVYFALRQKPTYQKVWLVFASLFFYGYWEYKYLFLITISMLVNYQLGQKIHFNQNKQYAKNWLVLGILFNVSLLGYFKYVDFFIENWNFLFGDHVSLIGVVLPLAISFFTFQQIAYLVDAYRNEVGEYSFLDYALFVTFFPQLIAGPIVHHKEMMPQFARKTAKFVRARNVILGMFIFTIGLFKKIVIADSFAVWANLGFSQTENIHFFDAWATSLSYTFQLYFDFSGYADMAIGAALMFNIRLPINFNSPYKALNIQDFWRRWHITLSRWLRDYVYIPLGGNRKGPNRTYVNLFATFLIGGFWHGASWTFVVWGAMHGLALIIQRLWSQLKWNMPVWLAWFITFNFVNVTWVFFRATSFSDAINILKGMAGFSGIYVSATFVQFYEIVLSWPIDLHASSKTFLIEFTAYEYIVVFMLVAIFMPNSMQMAGIVRYKGKIRFDYSLRSAFYTALVFSIAVTMMLLTDATEFLYFNF